MPVLSPPFTSPGGWLRVTLRAYAAGVERRKNGRTDGEKKKKEKDGGGGRKMGRRKTGIRAHWLGAR